MISPILAIPPSASPQRDLALHKAAQALEVNFLTEMLTAAGLGKTSDQFGGGAGEDQFGSFLRRAQAEKMVEAGGIGLAEHVFNSLRKGADQNA